MIVTFCGHSDFSEKPGDKSTVLDFLEKHVGESPCEFYLGGYGQFNFFAKNCCSVFRRTHPNAKLILITAYPDRIRDAEGYDEIIYPPIENSPPKFAVCKRNLWMADRADIVIAYVWRSGNGAAATLNRAIKNQKIIFDLFSVRQNPSPYAR